jgi:(p)ppGpp synthase/HD superfamily hydrolase
VTIDDAPSMNWVVARALDVAWKAHSGQRRKYTDEPYFTHPYVVAHIIAFHDGPYWLQAAALLHDTVEDTSVTLDELARIFPPEVVAAVDYMTERPHPGNRAARKAAECARLATGTADQQTLKLADLIDNTSSIVQFDPKFAVVYLAEKRALLDALTAAWPKVRAEAQASLQAAEAILYRGVKP